MKLGAQALSGVYTINQAQATGGTNFQNFTAFANAVNSNGVSGPITVNVVANSGPYNEQVQFNSITGASAANKITINGNSNLLTFSSSNFNQPWIILMNGADYFSVNNLNVQGTGTYAYDLVITNGANFNNFTGCTFSVQANTTSSNHIPVVFSANSQYYYYTGNSGSNNSFVNCGMFSGYFAVSIYGEGNYQNPIVNNTFDGCLMQDFYYYGLYNYYYTNATAVRNCTLECPTRTSNTTKYGIYAYASKGTIIEGNWIRRLYDGTPGQSATCYAIYCYYNTESSWNGINYPSTAPSYIRNNIISDIKNNATTYGIYAPYFDGEIYNNTIVFDYSSATANSTMYGIYGIGYQSQYLNKVYNNIIHITRGGGGTRYGFFNGSGTTGSDLLCDRNNITVTGNGTNYLGYYTAQGANLAALQSQGCMQNGFNQNPNFNNAAAMDYKPTNNAINNAASPAGLFFDQRQKIRNQSTPDIGAIEFLTPQCSGTPTLSVTGPSYSLCPGETADFNVSPLAAASDDGLTFQWQTSTISNVGPWTPISNASGLFYSASNQTTAAWYSAVITCTAPGGGSMTAVAQVSIASPVQSTIPYHEDFENIGKANRLPNCSWSAPTLGASAETYTSAASQNRLPKSGNNFATFKATAAGTNYFYTNEIWMEAGVTYSASVWYQTDFTGANNWTSLSIMYGPNQSATGLTNIATTAPAISPVYKSLSNTYTVPTSGYYYVAIKAVNNTGSALYLSWDDLDIMIPCSLNSPSVTVSANNSTVCAGSPVVLNASGATSYVWNTGATGSAFSASPVINPTTYTVTGTNTLTGCSANVTKQITVKPAPSVNISVFPPLPCEGQQISISASGANQYAWTNGATSAVISVTAANNGIYAVNGTNAQGCAGSASVVLATRSNPTVTANASVNEICIGESVTITGSGANSYQVISSSSFLQANPAIVMPTQPTTYTVIGIDNFGCTASTMLSINVNVCESIAEYSANSISVYPNPVNNQLNIVAGATINNVVVMDMTGRVILEKSTDTALVDMSSFANGVYYVKVATANSTEIIKVVKQ